MSPEEFRREIRTDPFTGNEVIVLPELKEDLYYSLTSTKGNKIDFLSMGKANVTVTTPETPLFLLEEKHVTAVGDSALYDRSSAFGADERFLVNEISAGGLEVLLEAFKTRSMELQTKAPNGKELSQFYPYAIYTPHANSLVGVLLASRAIAPVIKSEMKQADSHYQIKKRSLYKDLTSDEKRLKLEAESRFVVENDDYIAFLQFAPSDQFDIRILPKQDIPRFTGLSQRQTRNLALIIYDSISRIQLVAKLRQRYLGVINLALHSAPVLEEKDYTRLDIKNPLEIIYNFHVEIRPGTEPFYGAPYEIPFSGWTVNADRPKNIAQQLRRSNH